MKICFVVDSYPSLSKFGGIAAYTRTAARALAARGHDVHVLIVRRDAPSDSMDGDVQLHVRRVKWLPLIAKWVPGLGESIGTALALSRLHRRFAFDVVEFPNWEGIGFVGALFRITRTVVRLHTSMAESIEVSGRTPTFGDRFMMWAERVSARRADRVVTHSKAHRDRLRETYGLGPIDIIPHGIPLPERAVGGCGKVDDLSTPAASLPVMTVGPLNARKGAPTLLKAIPLVIEKVPNAEFWIVGGDESHPLAKQFRAENPGATGVRFLGFVEGDRLAALYASCAVYVSASVYESFGLTFVEAMAYGKPVVGCAAGAVPEIVEHEINGLIAPPGNAQAFAEAIIRLLSSREERDRLGRTGEWMAHEKYSVERMGENIERFFEETGKSPH